MIYNFRNQRNWACLSDLGITWERGGWGARDYEWHPYTRFEPSHEDGQSSILFVAGLWYDTITM